MDLPVISRGRVDDNGSKPHPLTKTQFIVILTRLFKHYNRMPSYIFGKLIPTFLSSLSINFPFYGADSSSTGIQSIIFAVFMVLPLFPGQVSQLQPQFITLDRKSVV